MIGFKVPSELHNPRITSILVILFCFACILPSSLAISSIEQFSLSQLMQQWPILTSPSTTNPWNPTDYSQVCRSWNGVTCNAQGNISSLSLSSFGLTGTIPAAIGNFQSLVLLDLSNNQLDGGIPLSILSLNLSSINLQGNSLDLCSINATQPVFQNLTPATCQLQSQAVVSTCGCGTLWTTCDVTTVFDCPLPDSDCFAPWRPSKDFKCAPGGVWSLYDNFEGNFVVNGFVQFFGYANFSTITFMGSNASIVAYDCIYVQDQIIVNMSKYDLNYFAWLWNTNINNQSQGNRQSPLQIMASVNCNTMNIQAPVIVNSPASCIKIPVELNATTNTFGLLYDINIDSCVPWWFIFVWVVVGLSVLTIIVIVLTRPDRIACYKYYGRRFKILRNDDF